MWTHVWSYYSTFESLATWRAWCRPTTPPDRPLRFQHRQSRQTKITKVLKSQDVLQFVDRKYNAIKKIWGICTEYLPMRFGTGTKHLRWQKQVGHVPSRRKSRHCFQWQCAEHKLLNFWWRLWRWLCSLHNCGWPAKSKWGKNEPWSCFESELWFLCRTYILISSFIYRISKWHVHAAKPCIDWCSTCSDRESSIWQL